MVFCLFGDPCTDECGLSETGWRGDQREFAAQSGTQALEQARACHQVGPGGAYSLVASRCGGRLAVVGGPPSRVRSGGNSEGSSAVTSWKIGSGCGRSLREWVPKLRKVARTGSASPTSAAVAWESRI